MMGCNNSKSLGDYAIPLKKSESKSNLVKIQPYEELPNERDSTLTEATQQAFSELLEQWQVRTLPVSPDEVVQLFVYFANRSSSTRAIFSDPFCSRDHINFHVSLLVLVAEKQQPKEFLNSLKKCFSFLLLYSTDITSDNKTTLYIETKAKISWTTQIITISVAVFTSYQQVFYILSNNLQIPLHQLLPQSIIYDRYGNATSTILSLLHGSNFENTAVYVQLLKSHIDKFIASFDSASREHMNGDRFKFLIYISEAYHQQVILHYAIYFGKTNLGDPLQAYLKIPKVSVRDIVNLEPRSTIHIPVVNNLKKDYVTWFVTTLVKLEDKLGVDFSSQRINTFLNSIIARDYFQNFRDSAVVNPKKLKPGRLFRSATLHNYTKEELSPLFEKANIRTIIDVRSLEDVQSKGYNESTFQREDGSKIGYFSVPIKPWTARKVPQEVGGLSLKYVSEPLCEENSFGFYEIFPRYFKKEIREVFTHVAQQPKPLLIHCALGKDRTGCLVALLELLVGFSQNEVVMDYLNSARATVESNIKILLDVVEESGGIEEFLLTTGVTKEHIERTKRDLSC